MNTSSPTALCHIDEIEEGGSKGLSFQSLSLFAVKKHGQVYLYENNCPHAGLPLNWSPDQFLDRDGELIQCASHGALFQINTGRCVAGPCPGRHLRKIPFTIENGCLLLSATQTK